MTDAHDNPHRPDPTQNELVDQLELEIESLLVEEAARAHTTPADLEAKVLALTDPAMLSLLDAALAPEQAPDQLAERIIAATMPGEAAGLKPVGLALASMDPASVQAPRRTGVLARLEPATRRYAAAAAIVLAAGIGLWWSGQNAPPPNTPTIADHDPAAIPEELLGEQIAFDSATQRIDASIQVVSNKIQVYRADSESLWSAVDEYEQFFSEVDEEAAGSVL